MRPQRKNHEGAQFIASAPTPLLCSRAVWLYQTSLWTAEDGTVMRHRGCLMGQANFTCSSGYSEKQQCTTLENGQQVSHDVQTALQLLLLTVTAVFVLRPVLGNRCCITEQSSVLFPGVYRQTGIRNVFSRRRQVVVDRSSFSSASSLYPCRFVDISTAVS